MGKGEKGVSEVAGSLERGMNKSKTLKLGRNYVEKHPTGLRFRRVVQRRGDGSSSGKECTEATLKQQLSVGERRR